MANDPKTDDGSPSIMQVIGSVLASFFGVQSSRARERDFTRGRPWVYIVVGLVATIVFILTVWFVVRTVVGAAGAG